MSIDRIGKGGGAGGPTGTSGTSGPGGVGTPAAPTSGTAQVFEVRKSEKPPAPGTIGEVKTATPLERLRAGHIDVNGYMDLKVDEATAHLRGLRPSELDAIRRMLRDKLSSDPALTNLVKGATGHAPVPQDE